MSTVRAFLEREPLAHLAHLKYLPLADTWQTQADGSTGVLLSYPTESVAWDQYLYPETQWILLPVAEDEAAAQRVLAYVRAQFSGSVAFKISDEATRGVFSAALDMTPTRSYHSFSTPAGAVFNTDAAVLQTQTPDATLRRRLAIDGYSEADVAHYFEAGACAFALAEHYVCTCMAFPNTESIWEIGALFTQEAYRGRGYARRVVSTALAYLLARDLTPRYQSSAENAASLGVARSLGLTLCMRLEHFTAQISPETAL